jgi:phospholipid/cholesterol/gamma-HCH transport system permease protein
MTGFVVAGRSVAAFAAEIGTMSVNQEIDALQTMDIDKTKFLMLPKIAAVMTTLPLLNLYMLLAGFVGCLLVFVSLGYSINLFYQELANAIRIPDLLEGLLKAMIFGAVIASIGCINGLKARQGSTSVGMAATRSVVSSIVMIAVIDGVFAVIFYNLGV